MPPSWLGPWGHRQQYGINGQHIECKDLDELWEPSAPFVESGIRISGAE